ncbi:MAG: hypothetical protein HZB30_07420 [Nitrospirae bacterium]|nr:hypothetical protein [Nitrospirota bacterium]
MFYSSKKRYKRIAERIQFSNLKCRLLYIKLTLFIIFFLSSTSLFAGEVTLKWYAPTSKVDGTRLKDLSGYKIYYGTASRLYTGYIDIGNVTTIRIGNLPAGFIYLALTAYDASGNESGYSNEVRKSVLADSDGIPDDGDDSGFIGDNPCSGGNTVNCDDNCPNTYNPDQADTDGDGVGDACDNCRYVFNPDQLDSNSEEDDNTSIPGIQHYGNVCDPDFDNNGIVSKKDKLKLKKYYGKDLPENKDYMDLDGDAIISKEDINIWRKYFRNSPGPGLED